MLAAQIQNLNPIIPPTPVPIFIRGPGGGLGGTDEDPKPWCPTDAPFLMETHVYANILSVMCTAPVAKISVTAEVPDIKVTGKGLTIKVEADDGKP